MGWGGGGGSLSQGTVMAEIGSMPNVFMTCDSKYNFGHLVIPSR